MNRWYSQRRGFAVFTLVLAILSGNFYASGQDGEATSEPLPTAFGPGPFHLLAPEAGLAELSSYRATLTYSFDGTNAGQPEQWSRTYTMLIIQSPPAWHLTIDSAQDVQAHTAEKDGSLYEWADDAPCVTSAVSETGTSATRWEPALFLDSVIGAEIDGIETIDGTTTDRYIFDERAFGAAGLANASGKIWIAADGGYLVRYTLETTAEDGYFGENIAGTLTVEYTLSSVNRPLTIALPESCPRTMADIPITTDAADLLQMPGIVTYNSVSSVPEVVAFYESQASTLGWEIVNPPTIADGIALFGFTIGGEPLLLIASAETGSTHVQIQVLSDPAGLAIAAELPDATTIEIPPEELLGHCAAGGVPMLPDPSNMIIQSNAFTYGAASNIEDAFAFYLDQFAALGAVVEATALPTGGTAALDVTLGFQKLSISLLAEGANIIVTVTSVTGSPLTPATECEANAEATASGKCPADTTPVLADATSVQAMGGIISYNTATSVAEAVTFYEAQFAARGGQVSLAAPATDTIAMLDVRVDDQSLMVMIIGGGALGSNVTISSMTGSPLASPSDCVMPAAGASD